MEEDDGTNQFNDPMEEDDGKNQMIQYLFLQPDEDGDNVGIYDEPLLERKINDFMKDHEKIFFLLHSF